MYKLLINWVYIRLLTTNPNFNTPYVLRYHVHRIYTNYNRLCHERNCSELLFIFSAYCMGFLKSLNRFLISYNQNLYSS